ncbi:lysosomal acid phosphatase-like [Tropilaelaps mercedesae]|uniref:Lysosomal acid phosphatase-like n=1 Tax=Tropilaelaps mercedesae TaxID=418985 RepID=A0A1V9XZL9_9ACAR|nr:lysosomal acid phosphatase-like [Tropilaelaps mercedesae]
MDEFGDWRQLVTGMREGSGDADQNGNKTREKQKLRAKALPSVRTSDRVVSLRVLLLGIATRLVNALDNAMSYVAISVFLLAAHMVRDADLLSIPQAETEVLEKTPNTLRQVHVFFRHGERMPTSLYPTGPNKPSDFKDGLGRITIRGKKDLYAMGEQLRKRYERFLTGDTNEIKARSSGRDRCLESMQTMLAALYKPETERKFRPELDWQPVPIATMPVDIDGMLYEDATCRKDDEAVETLRVTGEGKDVMEKYKDLMEKLQENSGKKMNDWVSVRDLLDTLRIEKSLGLQTPSWADEPTLNEMQECAKYTTLLNFKQDERIRFRAGLLLKDISMHFDDVVNNAPKHKIYAYASHDVLVSAYLSAFDAFNGFAVPSSAAVLIELHEDEPGQYRVQTFFRNNTDTGAIEPVHVAGCKENGCWLAVWKDKVSRFIPSDWREECGEPPLPVKVYDFH